MNSPLLRKVIKASAGTGKTHRLSLEFIALLLRYQRTDLFKEITVITFTNMATAEIRQKILQHLLTLTYSLSRTAPGDTALYESEYLSLVMQLQEYLARDINDHDISFLFDVYSTMLKDKAALQITTIDAFISRIFKGLVAPFLNIGSYTVDEMANQDILPLLYEQILQSHNFSSLKPLFTNIKERSIDLYDDFFNELIRNRWFFKLIDEKKQCSDPSLLQYYRTQSKEKLETIIQENYDSWKTGFYALLESFCSFVESQKGLLAKEHFSSAIRYIFHLLMNEDCSITKMFEMLNSCSRKEFLNNYALQLLGSDRIYNGQRFRKNMEEFDESLASLNAKLADCYVLDCMLSQEKELISMLQTVLTEYDKIKMEMKAFTFDDIAYYTYDILYNKELSLIDYDNGIVMNEFYEYLTQRIRFLLIDEFQDTGILQFNILLPIIKELVSGEGQKEYGGVIVVGDEKQSIYGWRGGEPELLLDMTKVLDIGANILNTSFRSTTELIDFHNTIFKQTVSSSLLKPWDYLDVYTNEINQKHGYLAYNEFNTQTTFADDETEGEGETKAYRYFVQKIIQPAFIQGSFNPGQTVILARKNKELNGIAAVLNEYGIDYIFESSLALPSHRLIEPIIHLIRFAVYHIPFDLFCFLRSDYLRMYPDTIKRLAQQILKEGNPIKALETMNDISEFDSILALVESADSLLPSQFIFNVLSDWGVTELIKHDNDAKNLYTFQERVLSFEIDTKGYSCTLEGFLHYLDDQRERSSVQSMELNTAITLMTVHKSKGLGFDSVFLYYNASGRMSNRASKLSFYYHYQDCMHNSFKDYLLTYQQSAALKKSSFSSLIKRDNDQNEIEELNIFYVALTRAKCNLNILISYSASSTSKSDSSPLHDYLSKKSTLVSNLFRSIIEYNYPQTTWYNKQLESVPVNTISLNWKQYLQLYTPPLPLDSCSEGPLNKDWYKIFLIDRKNLYGQLVHYYLSWIEYDSVAIRKYARKKTIQMYGNLLARSRIFSLLDDAERFIEKNQSYFSQQWDKIFNEHTIFSSPNLEYRIDRLMVNTKSKLILIVDYKTGDHEEEQLDNYVTIVSKLPYILKNNYVVEGKYVSISLRTD